MPCIDKIDKNTLVRIIQYAVGPKADTISEWKLKLKYLHVCSLWADIVKPLVLTEGFIEMSVINKREGTLSTKPSNMTKCESNTPVLIHHGYHHYVKSFKIRSSRHIWFVSFFRMVFKRFQPDIYEWPSVNTLQISMTFEISEYLCKHHNVLGDEHAIDFAEKLYKCMPSIKHLSIHEHRKNSAFIANPLANRYMRQLVYLSTSGSIDFSMSHFCADLRWLEISLNSRSNKIYLPQLRAAPLETLSLIDVPQQFSWAEFYDADGPNITFYSLKILRLNFIDSRIHSNDDNVVTSRLPPRFIYYRLHFPKLSKLMLRNCPPNSELFHCQEYFNNLELLNISGYIDSIEHVQGMGFHALKDLVLTIFKENRPNKEAFYVATNHIFGKLKFSGHVYFYNWIPISYDDIQLIEWSFLTCIHLVTPICFNVYIRLTAILPSLIRSIVDSLVTDGPTSYVNDIGSDNKPHLPASSKGRVTLNAFKSLLFKPNSKKLTNDRLDDIIIQKVAANVVPVSSSQIKAITLYFSSTENSYSRMVVAICCIIASFPSLIKAYMDPQFKNIGRHIAQLGTNYNSVSNISFKFLDPEIAEERAINKFIFV